jgi:hypothetical protein
MESLLKFLRLTEKSIPQCGIHIDNNESTNGFGLIVDEYVLTLYHIISGTNIHINKIKYKIIHEIVDYDIVILCKHAYNGNIYDFLEKMNRKIINKELNMIKISDINASKEFKIFFSNLVLNFNDIENTSLKSNILPQILLGKFNILDNPDLLNLDDLCGLSGSICYIDDNIFGFVISENNGIIEVIPLEIILDLVRIHSVYGIRYFQVNISGNIIPNNYKNFNKNDRITHINNIEVDDFGMVLFDRYNKLISINTYIMLFDKNKIDIKILRNTHKSRKEFIIKYKIDKFTENKILINIKENNKYIIIKDLCFKELSEEYLVKIFNTKKIPEINYDNIHGTKKMIYLDTGPNSNPDIMTDSVLLLNKISGHNIYNLNQIKHYTNQKNCVFELIDTNNNIIKVRY